MMRANAILGAYVLATAIALFSGYFSFDLSFNFLVFGLGEIAFVVFVTFSSPLLLKKYRFNYRSAAPYIWVWGIAVAAVILPHILQPDHFHGQNFPLIITLLMVWLFIPFSENLNALGSEFSCRFLIAMSLIAIAYSVVFIVFYPLGIYVSPHPNPVYYTFPGFSNIRHMGFVLTPLLAVGFVLAAGLARRPFHPLFWVYGVGLPVLLSMLLWSSTRAGILSLVLGLLVTVFFSGHYRSRLILLMIFIAPIGAALTLVYPDTGSGDFGFWKLFSVPANITDVDAVSSGRIEVWMLAFENIKSHPILGHGILGFKYFAPVDARNISQIHNSYLEYLHAGGLIAGLCIFGSMAFFFFRLLIKIRQSNDLVLLATFTGISVTLIYAFFDGVFVYFRPLMQIVILFAIANYHLRFSNGDSRQMSFPGPD